MDYEKTNTGIVDTTPRKKILWTNVAVCSPKNAITELQDNIIDFVAERLKQDGFVSILINYHHPKQKLICSINDNTIVKDLTVSVVNQEDGLTYLTQNKGENWLLVDDIVYFEDTIDCEITENDIEHISSFGDKSCGFVNKMTNFKKGPFRSNVIIARNW